MKNGLRPRIWNHHNNRFWERTKTAMEILSGPSPVMLAMPRFDDGAIDMQELCAGLPPVRESPRDRALLAQFEEFL